MQLKVVLLLVVFALVRSKEETCGNKKAAVCIEKLLSTNLEETTDEQECATLTEASSCLEEAAEDCTGEARNEDIEEGIQFLRVLATMSCPQDLSDDVEECVNDLESELMACIDEGVAEILEYLMELPEGIEVNEDDIKCRMYESITKCIVTKVKNKCGDEAGLAALTEMMDDDEIKEKCKIPTIDGSNLGGILIDLAKKRRK